MKKHTLTAFCILTLMAFCYSSSGEDSLVIMTPYRSGIEKGYIISLTTANSRQLIFSEGISANIEKGEIKIVYKNATMSVNDPNGNNVGANLVKSREYGMIFPRKFKIIIDGRIFPADKISTYLSNPEKYNKEQEDLRKASGTAVVGNIDCVHMAREGDTLDSISAMYSINLDDLKNANKKIKELKPGVEVTIPGNARNEPLSEKTAP